MALAVLLLAGNICEALYAGTAVETAAAHPPHHASDTPAPAKQHFASCESAVVVPGGPSAPSVAAVTGPSVPASLGPPFLTVPSRLPLAPGPAPGPPLFVLHASLLI